MTKRLFFTFAVLALAVATATAAPSMYGSRGLLRVLSADNDSRGAFSIGAHGTFWMKDSSSTHPWKQTNIGIFPHLSYAPLDRVELSAVGGYLLTKNEVGSTSVDVNGLLDTRVGLKLSYSPRPIFTAGLYGFGMIPTMDDTFVSGYDNKFKVGGMGLFTFDFGRLENPVPLRLHLNGGALANLNQYFMGADTAKIGEDDMVLMGAGLEYKTAYLTPFVEFSYAWPFDDSIVSFLQRNAYTEGPLVTPGLRFTFPFGLNFDAAVDVNLTSEDSAKAAVHPGWDWRKPWDWQVVGGLTYCYDFVPAVPPAPPTGTVAGNVTDAATRSPLEAEVSFPGTGVPSVYSDMNGAYTASGLPVGEVTVSVAKEGYIPQDVAVTVVKNKISTQNFALEKKPIPKGTIAGKVTDKSTGAPVMATISFPGSDVPSVATDMNGMYSVTVVAGSYTLSASADGYGPMSSSVTVSQNQTSTQDFVLLSTTAKITLRGIKFATGKSTITPESYEVLEDAIKLLNDYPNVRVEIAGHTDSRGSKTKNMKLSQARADAVREYLIGKGIAADRLVAKGYGSAEPVASNKTAEGREENRRIEFRVLPS